MNDSTLRTFLRCLILLIKAKALSNNADVVSVNHAYPSVFTQALIVRHAQEWAGILNITRITASPPLTESVAVVRYLQVEQNAPAAVNTIALDIGGSTTDIALWKSNELAVQESIKLAASVMGLYFESDPAFRMDIQMILSGSPFGKSIRMDESKNVGYRLLFNAILNYVSSTGLMNTFITSIQTRTDKYPTISFLVLCPELNPKFGAYIS